MKITKVPPLCLTCENAAAPISVESVDGLEGAVVHESNALSLMQFELPDERRMNGHRQRVVALLVRIEDDLLESLQGSACFVVQDSSDAVLVENESVEFFLPLFQSAILIPYKISSFPSHLRMFGIPISTPDLENF